MKRLLLDTNIYGLVVVDTERQRVHQAIHARADIYLYGCEVIRKELRSTKRTVANMNLRMNLLRVYDEFVKNSYRITPEMEELAEQYYRLYTEIGGTTPKSKLKNDFLIISCASIKNLDLVVSNDVKTMLSELAIKAYVAINKINKIESPNFISYEEFKNVIQK